MNKKKIIKAIGLVILAIIVVVWGLRHVGIIGGAEPPNWVTAELIEKIDPESGEVVTKPLGEWRELRNEKTGKYKNPKTGDYTMVTPMVCPNCKVKIPVPEPPENEWTYKCPRCGKSVVTEFP